MLKRVEYRTRALPKHKKRYPNKGGRSPLPPGQRLEFTLPLHVNAAEAKVIDELAKQWNLSDQAAVRKLIRIAGGLEAKP